MPGAECILCRHPQRHVPAQELERMKSKDKGWGINSREGKKVINPNEVMIESQITTEQPCILQPAQLIYAELGYLIQL